MYPLHPLVPQVHRVLPLSVSTCLYGYGCLTFPLPRCLYFEDRCLYSDSNSSWLSQCFVLCASFCLDDACIKKSNWMLKIPTTALQSGGEIAGEKMWMFGNSNLMLHMYVYCDVLVIVIDSLPHIEFSSSIAWKMWQGYKLVCLIRRCVSFLKSFREK